MSYQYRSAGHPELLRCRLSIWSSLVFLGSHSALPTVGSPHSSHVFTPFITPISKRQCQSLRGYRGLRVFVRGFSVRCLVERSTSDIEISFIQLHLWDLISPPLGTVALKGLKRRRAWAVRHLAVNAIGSPRYVLRELSNGCTCRDTDRGEN
ncbi:hypothetical protein B0T09DRAFT_169550 [Sordaria sp. MPI-SDFR-AT-0083]|nr:hypothetical protein B0T09DRAFT_169550 [Sordaria sp. MPI-SDFR-AT-0083]